MHPTMQFRPGMRGTTGRGGLALVVFGAILSLAPAPGALGQETAKPADGAGPDLPGQIYAVVVGNDPLSGFVAINPNDGTWTKLTLSRDQNARVSPDGRSLLHRDITGDRSTLILDVTGEKEPAVVLKDMGLPGGWSGDSRHVFVTTFSLMDRFPEKFETWKVSADGSERQPLNIPETEMVLDVSRDGEWLLTSSARPSPAGQAPPRLAGRALYLMHPDGSGERLLRPAGDEQGEEEAIDVSFPRLSPDGRKVLFMEVVRVANMPVPKQIRLVSLNTDGTDRRVLLDGTPEGPRWPRPGCWSPDGKSIAVTVSEGQLMTDGKPTPEKIRSRLVILDMDGKATRTIAPTDAPGGHYTIVDWR